MLISFAFHFCYNLCLKTVCFGWSQIWLKGELAHQQTHKEKKKMMRKMVSQIYQLCTNIVLLSLLIARLLRCVFFFFKYSFVCLRGICRGHGQMEKNKQKRVNKPLKMFHITSYQGQEQRTLHHYLLSLLRWKTFIAFQLN